MNNIFFKNKFGVVITESQASLVDSYYKAYVEAGIDKVLEYYEKNNLDTTRYQLSSGETIASLLNQYANKKVSFISNTDINGYKLIENSYYEYGILIDKSRHLENSNGQIIAFQKIDLLTDQSVISTTEKYSYDSNGNKHYLFDYDSNGDCYIINDLLDDDEDILASNIGTPSTNFSWVGYEYYQKATPFVPI